MTTCYKAHAGPAGPGHEPGQELNLCYFKSLRFGGCCYCSVTQPILTEAWVRGQPAPPMFRITLLPVTHTASFPSHPFLTLSPSRNLSPSTTEEYGCHRGLPSLTAPSPCSSLRRKCQPFRIRWIQQRVREKVKWLKGQSSGCHPNTRS